MSRCRGKKAAKSTPKPVKLLRHARAAQTISGRERGRGSTTFTRVINYPLDKYYRENQIALDQYQAGCLLFNDYAISHQHKSTLGLLGADHGVSAFSNIEYENPHTAFERYMCAMRAVGRVGQQIALSVCIEGSSLSSIHADMGWRALNSGMDRLIEVLDDLIIFYAAERRQRSAEHKRKAENHQNSVDCPSA